MIAGPVLGGFFPGAFVLEGIPGRLDTVIPTQFLAIPSFSPLILGTAAVESLLLADLIDIDPLIQVDGVFFGKV